MQFLHSPRLPTPHAAPLPHRPPPLTPQVVAQRLAGAASPWAPYIEALPLGVGGWVGVRRCVSSVVLGFPPWCLC